ncbi:MAG TPA: PAS domain-containing protein, partial [Nakamurella sp.]
MTAGHPRRLVRPSPKAVGKTVLVLSMLMLLATLGLGALVVQQTRTLQGSVAYTQEAVDSNVRTLGQVQRELLRLQVLLSTASAGQDGINLQESFVDQRVQEGSLPYQGETLGSADLLDRSRTLASRWTLTVRPAVDAALADQDPLALTAARAQLTALEKDYNQLVSDGEISRKERAGKANDDTRQLLSQTRTLMIGLAITAASFLLFLAVAGLTAQRTRRQREKAAAEMVALNAELRTHALIVHATDNLVVITDGDGRIEWVNDAFVRSTEYPLAAVKGRRPGEVLQGPATDPATIKLMHSAMADGKDFATDVLNYSASGREYWVHIEAYPVRDDAGRIDRFVAIQTDVTDRRRTEEELRNATDTALSLAEEKSGFLATMSHEIRTPL